MCTVTYVRNGAFTILTSNRDEHKNRPAAIHPRTYLINDRRLAFPKDPKAGGTWFVVDEKSTVGVLLNGAARGHTPEAFYRKSRGLVLLDIVAALSPLTAWNNYDLIGIESFTIVLSQISSLYQLRWDGMQKETQELAPDENHIWSSSTLYSPDVQRERQSWFRDFLKQTPDPNAEDMRYFHSNTATNNRENGLVINRGDVMKTFSITQAVTCHDKTELFHRDLLREHSLSNSFLTV